MLPIAVGLSEAQSIALELQDYAPIRPMTHDLVKSMVEALGGKVDRVQVDGLKDGAFLATIFLRQGRNEKQVDARPSDAMAIALRCNAPIYVSDSVMDKASILPSSSMENVTADEVEKLSAFRDLIEDLDLSDLDPGEESPKAEE